VLKFTIPYESVTHIHVGLRIKVNVR